MKMVETVAESVRQFLFTLKYKIVGRHVEHCTVTQMSELFSVVIC